MADARVPLRLIVGLGNPGEKYAKTRHNVGFDVVDVLAQRWHISWGNQSKFQGLYGEGWAAPGRKVGLLKPQTYMNRSGQSVRAAVDWYKLSSPEVLVIYDDMDLETGRLRLRLQGSAGGHNGIKSLIAHLGGQDFPRLRIGIGKSRAAAALGEADRGAVVAHVLGRPSAPEKAHMEQVITLAADAAEQAVMADMETAMNRFNGLTVSP